MYLELFGGLIYLVLAGDLLVRGAVALSKKARISPMVVGLTVVAFGTSAPELFISLGAAFKGHPNIAIGNVVGSNIANVLLVLGLPALIYPVLCNQESLGRDTALMIAASLLFTVFCFSGSLGPIEGVVMFAFMIVIVARAIGTASRGSKAEVEAEEELERVLGLPGRKRMIILFLVLGVIGLPLGANLMVDGAVEIARSLGVSDAVIGLSLVALGTSLPELGTTVVAAFHRHSDVALGNVLGSNLFNILAIMGITAVVAPTPIPVPSSFLSFDLLVMMAAATALAYFAWTKGPIGRRAGAALLASYTLYIATLFDVPGLPWPGVGAGL
jgi:cation:H+ antiporter